MAEVYRARDLSTGRSVAIKFLRRVDPQSSARFRTEIDVLCRLDHPGLVRLRGTGSHDGVPYLVLQLVDGPSLDDVLVGGPLGVEQSISIGQQLAEALAHAHGLGVVHRDVKPANVILDAEPAGVRLADFGIALFSDTTRMTAAGMCIGTAAYLAPEQLEGQAGPAADVYALGLVVLECPHGDPVLPRHPCRSGHGSPPSGAGRSSRAARLAASHPAGDDDSRPWPPTAGRGGGRRVPSPVR
jgi:eukaryotic-like serine/threonine-protein kinase